MSDSGTYRRLATILFADVAGYSRMMRAAEEQTLGDLRAHLAELIAPVVARHHGRIVKTVGDGILIEYGSPVEAVRCAIDLQRGMAERNATVPESRRQTFRIGLHLGDIIAAEDDVFGDAVNVAARLQALAAPGSIVISDSVHEHVRDKVALPFRDLGRRPVKNIDRPVHIFSLSVSETTDIGGRPAVGRTLLSRNRILAAVAALTTVAVAVGGIIVFRIDRGGPSDTVASLSDHRTNSVREQSVAVLVFANQSGEPGQDYFSDGLTEDITNALGRFKNLTVLAYGAVLPYKGKQVAPAEIGRTLNARFLVGGSVRKMGDRIRVTVQLSDAADGTQLWSDRYDDDLTDIFAVQERIARHIAGTLASNLQTIAVQNSLRKPTDNLDAYDLVLRGRAAGAEGTRTGNRKAREMLERATRLAPSYADAYAELAAAFLRRTEHGWSEFVQEDVDAAIEFAQKAVSVDEECVRAHGVLAQAFVIQVIYDRALAESNRALEINPSDATVHATRASVLLWVGRIDDAIVSGEIANRLNANLGPGAAFNLGMAYLLKARYADAIKLVELASARYPGHPALDFILAAAYAESGQSDEVKRAVERGRRNNPYFDLTTFGSRFQDPALQHRLQESLRKAGLN
jgi:class 3 adenylate cyclase/TolB-like protein/Tfp pilus assembly protein PilF